MKGLKILPLIQIFKKYFKTLVPDPIYLKTKKDICIYTFFKLFIQSFKLDKCITSPQ